MAALFWCFFAFGPDSAHPGLVTLVPITATCVLLALHQSGSMVHTVLSTRLPVAVGLISYSLYLVHQPLLAIARTVSLEPLSAAMLTGLLAASVVLAWLMWRFVERPFRAYDRFTLTQTFIGAILLIAAGVGVGGMLYATTGLPQRYGDETVQTVRPGPAPLPTEAIAGIARRTHVVLWGDSHSEMLEPAARRIAEATGGRVTSYHNGGCPPIPGFDNDWRNAVGPRCSTFNAQTLERVLDQPAPAVIVLAARWPNYLRAPTDADEFGHPWTLASRSIFPSSQQRWTKDSSEEAGRSLGRVVGALEAAGHRVILVGPVPNQRVHADDLGFLLAGNRVAIDRASVPTHIHDGASATARRMLAQSLDSNSAHIVDPADLFCDDVRCSYLVDGRMAYRDGNHLNGWGAMPLVSAIYRRAANGS